MNDERGGQDQRRAPLQFGIGAVLAATVAVAVLFGVLRWLEVPARAQYIVLAVVAVSVIAAVALLVVIAGSVTGEDDDERRR